MLIDQVIELNNRTEYRTLNIDLDDSDSDDPALRKALQDSQKTQKNEENERSKKKKIKKRKMKGDYDWNSKKKRKYNSNTR